MKKLYMILVLLFVAGSLMVQAQQITPFEIGGVQKAFRANASPKTPTDTIFLDEWSTAATNAYNYLAPGLGYILGPHWDTAGAPRSSEQAQGYLNMGSGYGIESVLIWTSIKYQHSANGSKLYVRIAKIDGTSTYTIGSDSYTINCPNTVLGRDTIQWADIDTTTAGWTIAQYNPPVYVPTAIDYAVVYNVSDFYTNGDTLSIIGGEGAASGVYGLEYTWYKYPNPALWTQFSHIWTSGGSPIDMAIAMFPVVDDNYINVGENGFANHIQLSQNCPNPSNGITSINYALDADAFVSFEVYDVHGKKIVDRNEGHHNAGTYTIVLANELAPGIYYYSLKADQNRLTKKMVIE